MVLPTNFARFNGGPWDGKLFGVVEWPPPEEAEMEGGKYIRKNYSQLTDEQASHPNIGRGAEYEWSEND